MTTQPGSRISPQPATQRFDDERSSSQRGSSNSVFSLPEGDEQTAFLDIDSSGIIRACSRSIKSLLGYRPVDLLDQHICNLLAGLDDGGTIQRNRIGQRLKFLCHCGVSFKARCIDGRLIVCRLFVHNRSHEGLACIRLILRKDGAALSLQP